MIKIITIEQVIAGRRQKLAPAASSDLRYGFECTSPIVSCGDTPTHTSGAIGSG